MGNIISYNFYIYLISVDTIRIELIQLSDVRQCGRLLAYYECNARDFLYPYPQYSITYGCADRQILLERTLEFPVSVNEKHISL